MGVRSVFAAQLKSEQDALGAFPMTDPLSPNTQSIAAGASGGEGPAYSAAAGLSELASLVQALQGNAPHLPDMRRSETEYAYENRLVSVRLGIASSLFASLRARHAPTATHSLRVALGCSTWAWAMRMSDEDREAIELAALMHDIGKLAVPDQVLLKPSRLTGHELVLMERQTQMGLEILSHCCSKESVLETIKYASAWYNGAKHGYDRSGAALPLGSRMLSIIDAFDSMTTDHVYRRALSRERAMAEIFEFAGAQFDPALAKQFCELLMSDWGTLQTNVTSRWLRELQPCQSNGAWNAVAVKDRAVDSGVERMFHDKLLESMHDGVMFVDAEMQIKAWNRGAERISGVPAESVVRNRWLPSIMSLQDANGELIADEECPVAYAVKSGVQAMRRVGIAGRDGKTVQVDLHVVPVIGRDGNAYGATVVLHDATSEVSLEQHVLTLYERATHDPLTKVANRAEFDRVNAQFVETHLARNMPCSLIICDIDHFKRINDTFGHPAGDEALVYFASLLKRHCRAGDLAARYGGEEFVLLVADCDNASAASRAEELRRELASLPQPALNGQCITASFGVTELQPGDTPETMLSRADRALLQAKDQGRNRVIQLGSGADPNEVKPQPTWWQKWWAPRESECLVRRRLSTPVPLHLAVQKLRGFVSDHQAQVIKVSGAEVIIEVSGGAANPMRRSNDRAVPFTLELKLSEHKHSPEQGVKHLDGTLIEVSIHPRRGRDRRRRDSVGRAGRLLSSLKSYMMAHEVIETDPENAGKRR